MIRKFFYIILLTILCSCHQEQGGLSDNPPDPPEVMQTDDDHLRGWVRIKLIDNDSSVISSGLSEIAGQLGGIRIERTFSDGGKYRKRRHKAGLHLWYDLYVGEEVPLTRNMTTIASHPLIEVIETIPVYRQTRGRGEVFLNSILSSVPTLEPEADISYPFNDPELHRQHHYQNFGLLPGSLAGADINLFPAWKKTTGDPSVIVAVLDGGIDFSHPDLAANMWINEAEFYGTADEDDDDNGYVDDIYGWRFAYIIGNDTIYKASGEILPLDHGTHCAGTIAAVNNNDIGGGGVAGGNGTPNSGVRLMSCQTFVTDPAFPGSYSEVKSTGKADEAWLYAADNGAVIASCSFSSSTRSSSYEAAIRYFIEHAGTDEEGHQTGPMKGGVIICSAGNDNSELKRYPAAYDDCISVAYIRPDYVKSGNSNYGDWVTLTAPGGSTSSLFGQEGGVFSTLPIGSPNGICDGYGYKTGSSMACPHVAGIAALIVSKFGGPGSDFTADKLKDILLRSTRNIDQYNPGYIRKLGSGLIDAEWALRSDEGIAPDPVPYPECEWLYNAVELSWPVTKDQNQQPAVAYEVYWSSSSFLISDPETPPEHVTKLVFNNSLPLGSPFTCTIEGFREATRYNLALAAVDEYGNRSSFRYISGYTDANVPPLMRDDIEKNIYLEKKTQLILDLDDYFYDLNEEEISYTVSCSDEDLMKFTLSNKLLILNPQTNGLSRIQITAKDPGGATGRGELLIMVRETSEEVDLYPNPVTDLLNIRMGKSVDCQVTARLYNSAGSKVMESKVAVSPFAPGKLKLSRLSGGSYIIALEYEGKTLRRTIIKH